MIFSILFQLAWLLDADSYRIHLGRAQTTATSNTYHWLRLRDATQIHQLVNLVSKRTYETL